jgi:hypothetical protein
MLGLWVQALLHDGEWADVSGAPGSLCVRWRHHGGEVEEVAEGMRVKDLTTSKIWTHSISSLSRGIHSLVSCGMPLHVPLAIQPFKFSC